MYPIIRFFCLFVAVLCVHYTEHAQSNSSAIFGSIGLAEEATLSFFSPSVYFYSGEILAENLENSQVYFAPTSQAIGASPRSYSQAPVVYTGTEDFLFPLGDRSAYHPLWMTAPSAGILRAAFVAEPHPAQFNAPSPFTLNPLFHWKVDGDKTAYLQLQWNAFNYNYPWTTNPDELRLVGFTGMQWEEIPTVVIEENTEFSRTNNSVAYRLKTRNKIDFTAYTALSLANAYSRRELGISEAITPNGDGINDTWHIANITQFPQAHISVYNRWGNQVFNKKNPYNNDWAGTFKNKPLPNAPYFYQIDLDQDGEVDQQGWIYIK